MAADSARMLELRRRVQADPSSIAFAQLAEECRRSGANDEAVGICRAGLARHPDYLSARVTLGRTLIELGRLDEAKQELDLVVASAPDNLAAIRGLAEILQRRGQLDEALKYFKRALTLARHDSDLEQTVERMSQAVAPQAGAAATPQVPVEEMFDFDKLLEQIGKGQVPQVPHVPQVAVPQVAVPQVPLPPVPHMLTTAIPADASDRFVSMERELRELQEHRARVDQATQRAATLRRLDAAVGRLESWLSAVVADRGRQDRS